MNEPTEEDVRALLYALRGKPPATCDWCGDAMAQQQAEPEEAGEWICPKCWQQEYGSKPP